MVDNGSTIHQKLFSIQNEICELSNDIPKLLETNGLRGKKFTKALDNFSYNLALLHGQTDLLNKAKQDANITIRQVRRQSLVNKSLSFFPSIQILEAAETTHLLEQSDE